VTKKPEINNLKEEKIYFDSQLQWFQSMVTWPCCFGLVAAQNVMVEYIVEEAAHFTWCLESREKKR
jgi:hypothetical protein